MKKKVKPSELEMQVLGVLWERGPRTVRDVQAALSDGKDRAYTTVLTVLQVMERKGLVAHTRDGLANVYRPLVTQDETVRPVLKTLLNNIFAGDPARVVQALVDSAEVSPDDLKQMRRIIDQASREAGKERKS